MGLRVVIVSNVQPVVELLVGTLRDLEHEPVAVLSSRRPRGGPRPPDDLPAIGDTSVPEHLDVLSAHRKESVEPLLRAYDPDLMLCSGFGWKIPPEALAVPRLGSVNCHPALLPRYRGPVPFAWTLRSGDSHYGITWHRMDAEFDTGPILAQASVPVDDSDQTILDIAPRTSAASIGLLPEVLDKVQARDPGEPQDEARASWGGHFEEDEYARVDWSHAARSIHDQVRAWWLTFNMSGIVAPVAELNGLRVRLVRTSLTDPGDGSQRVETGDGPLWIVESEPLPHA